VARRTLERIRAAIRKGSYDMTVHVVEEMAEDELDTIDVEVSNEAPRSKLRGITELNFEDFSETEANPVASYGEYSSSGRPDHEDRKR
jgi:hypothetical protein